MKSELHKPFEPTGESGLFLVRYRLPSRKGQEPFSNRREADPDKKEIDEPLGTKAVVNRDLGISGKVFRVYYHRLRPSDQRLFIERLLALRGFREIEHSGEERLLERDGKEYWFAVDERSSHCVAIFLSGELLRNRTQRKPGYVSREPLMRWGWEELQKAAEENPTLLDGFAVERSLTITSVRLLNFRGFQELTFSAAEHSSTVIVGSNGAGKSSILDALAMALSWLAKRIDNEKSAGRKPSKDDIFNGASHCEIYFRGAYYGRPVEWSLFEKQRGAAVRGSSVLTGLNKIVKIQQWEFGNSMLRTNLPVLVYYPVNRGVLDVPKRIRKTHHFLPLETYDDALVAGSRDFRLFFEWFRERENIENEQFRYRESETEDKELSAVRKAIEEFTGFRGLRIKRRPNQRMIVLKNDQELSINQLSDGEKCLLATVGDLARRLALANPEMPDPLQGTGIVLIDEIELHLHPLWQREVVHKLETTFPGCQFIITTHSPQVLSQLPRHSIRILSDFSIFENTAFVEGREANSILSEVMGVPVFPEETREKLDLIEHFTDKGEFQQAKTKLDELAQQLGETDPTIVHQRNAIDFLEEEMFSE